MADEVVLYFGALLNLDTSGVVRPGRTSATDVCVGCGLQRVDTRAANDPDPIVGGAMVMVATDDVRRYENSAGDEIAITDVGSDCYVVDDQTVALTDGGSTRCRAGKIFDVDVDGVWVKLDV